MDFKFLILLNAYGLILNLALIAQKASAGLLTEGDIAGAEIIVACLIFNFLFMLISINKIEKINKANIKKADIQRTQSDELLNTTLNVAASMTRNIEEAVGETESLKDAIGVTKFAMEELVLNTNEEKKAIDTQKTSTMKINDHIYGVGSAVGSIIEEVNIAEENLTSGNAVMAELLEQVRISEDSNSLVMEKMEGLKEYAEKMQAILDLIRSVASQTSLLSLNAGIEAARAGEAGKGFAVVASEISTLSTQTNHATGDIDKLIENIVKSIEEVTEAMDNLVASSQLQNQYVNNTADNFNKIHNSTQGIFNQVSHLKDTVEVVTEENQQVAEQIETVSSIMQRVMEGANQTYESCNTNLTSIANMSIVMESLKSDATKLQQ